MAEDEGTIGRVVPQVCVDCGCPPHRHYEPTRDRSCPFCGCLDLRAAKKERDAGNAAAHLDAGRNDGGGFVEW
jgi:hypothetical protein